MATAPKSTTSKKITPSVVTETAEKLEKVAVEANRSGNWNHRGK